MGTNKYARFAFIIGVVGLIIAAFGLVQGLIHNDSRLVFSWFMGFSVWFSLTIGMLFLLMIWHVFDAGWPVIIRRQVEHAVGFFPILALILLPLIAIAWFGSNPGILWPWMNPEAIVPGGHGVVAHDPLYLNKAGLLNIPFFTIRMVLYFSILLIFSKFLRNRSFAMDVEPKAKYVFSTRVAAAVGIPICALTSTFATFDLFMSLSYQWFSTMYGVWFFATSVRGAMALLVIICALLATRGYLKGVFKRGHLYNLGCMFLAFTVFWAYISFSQYFLIYNANIPEETFWYNMREVNADGTKSSWFWVSLFGMIIGYFIIPFFILLFYKTKVVLWRMVSISAWILTFFLFDMYFNILPFKIASDNVFGYVVQTFSVTLWDLAAIIGFGGFFVWSFMRSMSKHEPIPVHDPRIEESLHYHE